MVWNPVIDKITGEEHRKFLKMAYNISANSPDPSTKTGSIIVSNGEVIGSGYNHFPKGIEVTDELLNDRAKKLELIVHSEPASIYDVAKSNNSTEDAVMYMPWVPCTPCALSIIDSGISQLIGHEEMIMKTPERWHESTDYALGLLEEAGVKLSMYSGKIGENTTHLYSGKVWYP